MHIFGVVLAGGKGARMGADKALVPLAGQPLIAWVVERFAPQVADLVISANGDAARFGWLGLPVLADAVAKGPLSGILAALQRAAPLGATAVVCVPCDGPFLPPDLVARLCLAAKAGTPAIATSGADRHPTCSLWPVTLLPALEAFLASDAVPRVRDFALAHGATFAAFPPGSFTNANTAEDLARLSAQLAPKA